MVILTGEPIVDTCTVASILFLSRDQAKTLRTPGFTFDDFLSFLVLLFNHFEGEFIKMIGVV